MRLRASAFWQAISAKPAGACPTSRSFTAGPDWDCREIEEQRQRLAERIKSLPSRPPSDISGRGLVMAVGGQCIASAWVTLTILRDVQRCRLPIEIWYLDDDDLPAHLRRIFQRFDVEFVDASAVRQRFPVRQLNGHQLKPYAILHSRFAEVMLLDADNVPLIDPASLFEEEEYLRTGALFWPDIRVANPYNPIWSICDLSPQDGPEWESGQVVIDKTRCWPAMHLTMHFNNWSDFYFRYIYGDKETFHLAWRILGAPYGMPPALPRRAFGVYDDDDGTEPPAYDGLWQHDFRGRPIFLHHTDVMPVAWGRNLRCPGFELHETCLAALEELRTEWDGYLAPPPKAQPASGAALDQLAGRTFLYVRRGISARRMHLNPDGRIGSGAGQRESFWRLDEGDGQAELVLSSRTDDTCRLHLAADGVWRGAWLRFEQSPAELIPLATEESEGTATPASARRRMLFISPVVPVDTGNGLAMRAASVLRMLTRRYRVSLLIAPLYPSGPVTQMPAWLRRQCEDVRLVPVPELPGGERANTFHDDRRGKAWREDAGRAYAGEAFDVIHVFRLAARPFTEFYLLDEPGRAVEWHLDLDDIESRTERRLAGLFARHALTQRQNRSEQLAERAFEIELDVLRSWDRVYVCSDADRAELLHRIPDRRAEIVVLPNVVALPPEPRPAPRVPPLTLLYVGTFDYFPNEDAARWFCREILPLIREQTPVPIRVLLIGTGATPELAALGHIPEVEYIGPVSDLAGWYAQADLVIVPLRAGGGTRIKILEALAQRRPVVSTSIGAEGLGTRDGEHLLIADRAHHFARQCLRLMGDAQLAAQLADRGREFVERNYGSDVVSERLTPVLGPPDRSTSVSI